MAWQLLHVCCELTNIITTSSMMSSSSLMTSLPSPMTSFYTLFQTCHVDLRNSGFYNRNSLPVCKAHARWAAYVHAHLFYNLVRLRPEWWVRRCPITIPRFSILNLLNPPTQILIHPKFFPVLTRSIASKRLQLTPTQHPEYLPDIGNHKLSARHPMKRAYWLDHHLRLRK